MKTLSNILGVAMCLAALCAPVAWAQQQTPDQSPQPAAPDQGPTKPSGPIPAYRSPLAGVTDNGEDTDTGTELSPDTNSLTGVQNFTLGLQTTRSYWQPHVDFATTVDSNPQVQPGQSGWGTWTSFSGGIDVHRTSGNSELALSYTGGGMISNNSSGDSGTVQELNFSDKHSFRRWAISFFEALNYLPGAASGFNGLGGVGLAGGGTSGSGSTFNPTQLLLTGQGQVLDNSFNTEADVFLTGRTSLTFVGGYSLGHYFESDLYDYGNANFRAGYNYQMNRKDTIGLSYTFSAYNYSNSDQSITSHTAQVSYGRRVTGRLAFQIAAGPQISFSHQPITAAGGTEGTAITSTTLVNWALNANVQYQLQRTGLALAYNHGVGGGSGLLAGSLDDTVTGSVTRQVSRTFSSGITGGYTRNSGAVIGTTPANQTYDYWFAGANLSHPVGRTLALSLSYQFQYQNANTAVCTGTSCGANIIRQTISFGLGWHERPLLF
jgi:hypothetical protein